MMRQLTFFLFVLLSLVQSATAQADVQVAMKAIERGHYSTAQRALRKSAESGDVLAQNNLAYLYEHGLGVNQNYNDAVIWYTKAAEGGLAQAQFNLAGLL
jgi:TPR repeat protein